MLSVSHLVTGVSICQSNNIGTCDVCLLLVYKTAGAVLR